MEENECETHCVISHKIFNKSEKIIFERIRRTYLVLHDKNYVLNFMVKNKNSYFSKYLL